MELAIPIKEKDNYRSGDFANMLDSSRKMIKT